MPSPSFDVFKKNMRGNPIWLDAVSDLETAQLRLNQLASIIPGQYFAFDQRTHRIVASLVQPGSDRVWSQCDDLRRRKE
jgi:hypothetical protein